MARILRTDEEIQEEKQVEVRVLTEQQYIITQLNDVLKNQQEILNLLVEAFRKQGIDLNKQE